MAQLEAPLAATPPTAAPASSPAESSSEPSGPVAASEPGAEAPAEPTELAPSSSSAEPAEAAAEPPSNDPCVTPPPPLPSTANPAERYRSFREPLPAAPLWSPPGPRRVGLQAGHWLVEQVPAELSRLEHGSSGGGRQEWEVNLDLARRVAQRLELAGVEVDLLPTTVPPRYRAHAFVSIHADGDPAGRARGFKVARPGFSSVPAADDRLVEQLNLAYADLTGLPRDDEHITPRMRYYYAFNSRRYCHAVAPGVPQVIVEAGFLTSALDRALLLGNPELPARGIAEGVLAFLREVHRG